MFSASSIISIIAALLGLARYFTNYAAQNGWIETGKAQAILKGLQDADGAIKAGNDARETVRAHNTLDPASVLRDDDGFRRPD
jgi:hypothetical protein